MPRMNFSTSHLVSLFGENGVYDWNGTKNLMFDLAEGRDVFDADGNLVSKADANAKLQTIIFSVLGIDKNATKRDRKRAMKNHHRELFEILEELIDHQVSKGFRNDEFFDEFVDYRNIALGDSIEFYTEDDTLLAVGKVSGGHHDLILQRPAGNTYYTIPVERYGAAVGADIDRYLAGQEDWAKLVDKLAKSFLYIVRNAIYTQVIGAYTQVPVQTGFIGNNQLVKATLDTIIENVAGVNDSDVYIMGTKTALKKLSELTDVNWRSEGQKEDYARMGRIGSYEGTDLLEIPQRFEINGTTLTRLVRDDILLIMPKADNKFVKFVDQGETEIDEILEKGEEHGRIDDVMKYEIQRSFGIAVNVGRYFGAYIIGQ